MENNIAQSGPANRSTPTTPQGHSEERELLALQQLESEARERLSTAYAGMPKPKPIAEVAARVISSVPTLSAEQVEERRRRQADYEKRQMQQDREAQFVNAFSGRTRYRGCRLSNYVAETKAQRDAVAQLTEYAAEMPARVAEGQSIVLFGPAGTGKDHLMAAMLFAAIVRHGLSVKWRNGMDLFGEFRDAMDTDKSEASMVRSLVFPKVLAISDPLPPFEGLTAFQSATLFRVIDGRYSERKPTWITMNASDGKDAEQRMGVQLVDRLRHAALVIPCFWKSFRQSAETTPAPPPGTLGSS